MKKRSKAVIILLIVAVLIVTLAYISYHPFVFRRCEVPEDYLSEIYEQAIGPYSYKLPLLPFYLTIEDHSDDRVYYAIHYFPFGTVGMSYSSADGFNIEKPLSGQ